MTDDFVTRIAALREEDQRLEAQADAIEARRWAIQQQIMDLRFEAHASRGSRPHKVTVEQMSAEAMGRHILTEAAATQREVWPEESDL